MKTYKLIKTYPACDAHLGDTVTSNSSTNYHLWPEFWQEIKQPLFKTHDGVELFENDKMILVNESFDLFKGICNYNSGDNTKLKYFSTEEEAEKWIDENKPVFSKKMLRDAIAKNTSGMTHLSNNNFVYMIYSYSFKQELGL